MNVLYYSLDEIIADDVVETMQAYGCVVEKVEYELGNNISDAGFIAYIEDVLRKGINNQRYDYIFSCNFLPVISKIAVRNKIKYISWCYDSPCTTLYSDMIYNPYNCIFLFDNYEVLRLKRNGVRNVFHIPLVVNAGRIKKLLDKYTTADTSKTSDITFMGNLYTDNSNYENFYNIMDDYTKGLIDALVNVQGLYQGTCVLDEMFVEKEYFMSVISDKINFTHMDEFRINDSDVVKNLLYKKISSNDRLRIIKRIAEHYNIVLYSNPRDNSIISNKNVDYRGVVEYYNNMPVVFNHSKININTTIRSIHTGIPLRCMDIMAAGGFLLSNYQEELGELFTDGEDMVMFYDDGDMTRKIDYYISHDEERKQIAANGQKKILRNYDYSKAWKYILMSAKRQM